MSLAQTVPKINPTVIPFTSQPTLARRVRGLMMSFIDDKISRAARNEYLAEILPYDEWIDIGSYRVRMDGYIGNLPVITFVGDYSPSGTCPVCLCNQQGSWLGGEGLVQLYCKNCGAIYSAPEGGLR